MVVWPKAIFNLQHGEYGLQPNGGNGYLDLGRCHQATVKKAFGHTKTCDAIDFLDITPFKKHFAYTERFCNTLVSIARKTGLTSAN